MNVSLNGKMQTTAGNVSVTCILCKPPPLSLIFFSYSFIYTLLSSSPVHVCNWRCVINTHCLGGTGIIKRLARKGREDRGGKNKKESGDQRVNVG